MSLSGQSSPSAFGQRIRELRKARSLDQRALAERVEARLWADGRRGFDVTYLSKIENGRVPPPSMLAIIALAEALGADVDALATLAGRVPPGVGELLRQSEGARGFWREAVALGLGEEDWEYLTAEARRCRQAGRD